MANKPSFLKNLLTTASALAVVAAAGSAFADDRTVTAAASDNTGVGLNQTGSANVAVKPNDRIIFNAAGQTFTAGAVLASLTMSTSGAIDGTVTATAAVTDLSFINSNNGAGGFTLQANAGGVSIKDSSALKKIVGNHVAHVVTFNSDETVAADIDQVAVTIAAGKKVTLKGALGANTDLGNINVGNGSTLTISSNTVKAATIQGAAVNQGDVVFSRGTNNSGVINVNLTGVAASALQSVSIEKGTTVELAGNGFNTKALKFNAADATLKTTNANAAVTVAASSIVANSDGFGVIASGTAQTDIFQGNGTGSVGASGASLAAVQFSGNGGNNVIEFRQYKEFFVKEVTTALNGIGKLNLTGAAADFTLSSNIGTATNRLAEVTIDTGAANRKITFAKDAAVNAATFNTSANNGATWVINGSGVKINADTITANSIEHIQFAEGGSLDLAKSAVFGTGFKAGAQIKLVKDSTLSVSDTSANFAIDQGIDLLANADGSGTIVLPQVQVTFNKAVGDIVAANKKSLKNLKIVASTTGTDSQVTFNDNASIKNIDNGNVATTIQLSNGAARSYMIGGISNPSLVSVELLNDTTLTAGTVLSAEKSPLKGLKFTADKALTLEDGVNLYTKDGIKNTAVNHGTINFAGESTVTGDIGTSAQVLKAININGAKKVSLGAVYLQGDVTIANGATASFSGNVTAANIAAAAASTNTNVVFNNSAAITVNAAIGNANAVPITAIEIAGSDVTFGNNVLKTAALKLTSTEKATVTLSGVNALANIGALTTTGKGIHNLKFSGNQDFNIAIGTDTNRFGNVTIDAIATINQDVYANIITAKDKTGTVNFNTADKKVVGLGSASAALAAVNFNENGTVLGDMYADVSTVAAAKTATLGGVVKGTKMTLNNGSTAVFGEKSSLQTDVVTAAANQGIVEIKGTNVKNVGTLASPMLEVKFTGTSNTNLSGDLYAKTLSFNKSPFTVNADNVKLGGGAATFTDSTIDLQGKKLSFLAAGNKFAGNMNVKVTVDENNNAGKIVLDGAASAIDASGTNITFTLTDKVKGLPDDNGRIIKITDLANGAASANLKLPANMAIANNDKWYLTYSFKGQDILASNNVEAGISTFLKDSDALENAKILVAKNNTGSAKALLNDLVNITDADIAAEAINRLANPVVDGNQMASGVLNSSSGLVASRINDVTLPSAIKVADAENGSNGVAAGEAVSQFGVWATPFFGGANQSKKDSMSGYDQKSYGVMIGADTMVNDIATVGIAGTYSKTDLKHKNVKSGDKTKADNYLVSVYGLYQFMDDMFVQAVASGGTSKVKNTEKRTLAGNETAKGSYNAKVFGGQIMAGYNYKVASDVLVVPTVGLSYSNVGSVSYTETGTANQNLKVSKNASNKLEAIVGAKVAMASSIEGAEFMPEVHAFVRHDFIGKAAKVNATLNGAAPFKAQTAKLAKTSVDLGMSLNFKSGMFEYGAGYDANIASKYVAHQGAIKVRVNF